MNYIDRPIENSKEDELGRSYFSGMLAEAISKLDCEDTFTIGLYGKWGSGKTSIINMLINNLENNEKISYFRFEPWNFSDENQLLSQFFVQLSDKLKIKDEKIRKNIAEFLIEYSSVFTLTSAIPVYGPFIALLGEKFTKQIGRKLNPKPNNLQEIKEKIIKELKKLDYKILIIIDDLDRLDCNQLCSVFKLIASVGNFPNLIYLVSFDKEIVTKALEEVQKGDGSQYLEKIIQMPIEIPQIRESDIKRIFIERMSKILSTNIDCNDEWQLFADSLIFSYLKHIRDINRLCNLVQFKYSIMKNEVNIYDLIAISSIEINEPEVYKWIKSNKTILTGEDDIEVYFNDNGVDNHVNKQLRKIMMAKRDEKSIDDFIKGLAYLFPHFGRFYCSQFIDEDLNKSMKSLNISHPKKFERYFDLDVNKIIIKKEVIDEIIFRSNCQNIVEILLEYDNKNLCLELFEELKAHIERIPENRIQIFLDAMFEFSLYFTDYSEFCLNLKSNCQVLNFILKLMSHLNQKKKKAYIINKILKADKFSFEMISLLVCKLESEYGRNHVGAKLKDGSKTFSLEELSIIEKVYLNQLQKLLSKISIFDLYNWKKIYSLLEVINPKFLNNYFKNYLYNDVNIAKYSTIAITKIEEELYLDEYEVNLNNLKYVTKNEVINAIENLINSKQLITIAKSFLDEIVALYIGLKNDNFKLIIQQQIDDFLLNLKKIDANI